jgi:excinuclease UvrABC nuclease subunit
MAWKPYSWLDLGAMPRTPSVYAIYLDGELVYVGQSVDLRNRFHEHKIRYGYAKDIRLPWVDVPDTTSIQIKASASRKYGDWAMRELRLIRRLKPRFNRHGLGRKLKVA